MYMDWSLRYAELPKLIRSQDIFIALQKVLTFGMPRPFSFLDMYLVVLSVIEGPLLLKKISNSLSISFILLRLRLGVTVAI